MFHLRIPRVRSKKNTFVLFGPQRTKHLELKKERFGTKSATHKEAWKLVEEIQLHMSVLLYGTAFKFVAEKWKDLQNG